MSDSENQNQSHDDDDHDGDYTIGDDGSNYSVIQRMQHWMGKFGIGVITDAIRSAVEAGRHSSPILRRGRRRPVLLQGGSGRKVPFFLPS